LIEVAARIGFPVSVSVVRVTPAELARSLRSDDILIYELPGQDTTAKALSRNPAVVAKYHPKEFLPRRPVVEFISELIHGFV
jgi:hypothetical protein